MKNMRTGEAGTPAARKGRDQGWQGLRARAPSQLCHLLRVTLNEELFCCACSLTGTAGLRSSLPHG